MDAEHGTTGPGAAMDAEHGTTGPGAAMDDNVVTMILGFSSLQSNSAWRGQRQLIFHCVDNDFWVQLTSVQRGGQEDENRQGSMKMKMQMKIRMKQPVCSNV